MCGVNLASAKLKKANLEGAKLKGASMAGANLNGAILANADLRDANFRQARMAKTDLRGALLDGSNLFATIREEWLISGVSCTFCWITKDKAFLPNEADYFYEDQFEMIYGGIRVCVGFPDGIKQIDLLALPYHASQLIKEFPDNKIVLTGLDTTGDPHLVFRIEEGSDKSIIGDIENKFQRIAQEVRIETQAMYTKFLETAYNNLQKENNRLIEVVETLVNKPSNTIIKNATTPIILSEGSKIGTLHISNSWNDFYTQTDQGLLRKELEELAEAIKKEENEKIRASIIQAISESKANQPAKMRGYLIKGGKYALDIAVKIGTSVAAKAISTAIGLGK